MPIISPAFDAFDAEKCSRVSCPHDRSIVSLFHGYGTLRNDLFPLGFEVAHKQDSTEGPSDGIRPEYHPNIRNNGHGNGDVGDPDGAPAQQHNDHGDLCLACTPEDARTAVAQSQKAPEQRFNMRLLHPIGNDVRIPVERCHQPGCRGEYDHTYQLCNTNGA